MHYEEHRNALITYLRAKVEAQDWHGVSDAANDLRELEAERRGEKRGVSYPKVSDVGECHFDPEKAGCFWPQCPTRSGEICKLQWRGSFLKQGGNY